MRMEGNRESSAAFAQWFRGWSVATGMVLRVTVIMPRGSFVPHLILVKHALPEIIPTLPANQWHLSEVRSCPLCTASRPASHLCPSCACSQASEPKALETAHLVAQRMRMHECSDSRWPAYEHDRSNTTWLGSEELVYAVAAFFIAPAGALCWAVRRHSKPLSAFAKTVAEVTSRYAEQNVMSSRMTAFLASLLHVQQARWNRWPCGNVSVCRHLWC